MSNPRLAKALAPRDRRLVALALALTLGWAIVSVYALHAAMPFNPIRLPFESQLRTRIVLPEGWAFFTRDPREERTLLFRREPDGRWRSASLGPHARPANLFGWNRYSRAQGVETGLLLANVKKTAWQPCQTSPEACLERAAVSSRMSNISPRPTLCGQIGLVMRKPVPWAWSKSRSKIVMPSRVARLEVTCE